MPDNKTRGHDQGSTNPQSQPPPANLEGDSKPPFIEGAETEVISQNAKGQQYITKYDLRSMLRGKGQIVLSTLTLLAIIGQAYIFDKQWDVMQTSIDETRHTRELEYRAYVGAKSVILQTRTDNPAWGDVYVLCINTGRTPGVEGKLRFNIEKRDTSLPENYSVNDAQRPGSKTIYLPNIEVAHVVGAIGTKVADVLASNPLDTQLPSNATGNKSKPKTQTSVSEPLIVPNLNPPPSPNLTSGWYVFGIIEYKDIFGKPHFTKFCFINTPGTASWSQCTTYNDAN
jgi:hypothetical protein